jgi:uncharacterized protein (DUF608 family)
MVAMPMGGIGTGCVSLGGRGELRDWEIFNRPGKGKDLDAFVLLWARKQGEEPVTKSVQRAPLPPYWGSGGWRRDGGRGLPCFPEATFKAAYPFGEIDFEDKDFPLQVSLEGFNPLIPLNAYDSGLPAAVLTYKLRNPSTKPVEATLLLNMPNVVGTDGITFHGDCVKGSVTELGEGEGFQAIRMTNHEVPLGDPRGGTLVVAAKGEEFTHLLSWPQGEGWWDSFHMFWDDFAEDGTFDEPGPGGPFEGPHPSSAALGVKVVVKPRSTVEIPFVIAWHFPTRVNQWDREPEVHGETVVNEYNNRFDDAWNVAEYVMHNLGRLHEESKLYQSALFDSSLPGVVLDAVSTQSCILKSQTSLWLDTGDFHGFEGCSSEIGCCPMNCTHVWNYEQTLAYLFPQLERTVRRTDYLCNVREDDSMAFRTKLPLGKVCWDFKPAADGQMGTILKLYREWLLSGDDDMLRELWPNAKRTMDYAQEEWDADGDGVMEGEQHNTYDIEFFGANTMMGTLYLGALKASAIMADRMGDEEARDRYEELYTKGTVNLDGACWDKDYYIQVVDLDAHPRYQYGKGCLADQLLGQWFSHVVGLGHVLPRERVKKSLQSLFRHNFRTSFYDHANPQRIYALADEAGLLLCTWPKGGRPALPVVYGDEVWTGIEYQVAAHMIYEGLVDEGLSVVKGVRDRHDGIRRNPFNEFECGDHYARALASWSVLLALSGYQYSAPDQRLSFAPCLGGSKFECFFSTGTGWGTVAISSPKGACRVMVKVLYGTLDLKELGTAALGETFKEPKEAEAKLNRRKVNATATTVDGRAMATFEESVHLEAGDSVTVSFG